MLDNEIVIAIVTPAYEEWENLFELAPTVLEIIGGYSAESEWIVVCESSPPSLLRDKLQKFSDQIQIIERLPGRESFANALEMGLSNVRAIADYVVTMDGDHSHQPRTIQQLISAFSTKELQPDVVIASRYVEGGDSENSFTLKAMSIVLNLAFRLAFKLDAKDLSTNFKAFHASDVRDIKLQSRNFEAVEELLLHVRNRKNNSLRIVEIPDKFAVRRYGHSKRRLGQFIGSYLISLVFLNRRVARSDFEGRHD